MGRSDKRRGGEGRETNTGDNSEGACMPGAGPQGAAKISGAYWSEDISMIIRAAPVAHRREWGWAEAPVDGVCSGWCDGRSGGDCIRGTLREETISRMAKA